MVSVISQQDPRQCLERGKNDEDKYCNIQDAAIQEEDNKNQSTYNVVAR